MTERTPTLSHRADLTVFTAFLVESGQAANGPHPGEEHFTDEASSENDAVASSIT